LEFSVLIFWEVERGSNPRRHARCRIFLSPSIRSRKDKHLLPTYQNSMCQAVARQTRRPRNIRDAVRGFLETSADMGTLPEVLEEAGYERDGETWRAPEFVSLDRLTLSVK